SLRRARRIDAQNERATLDPASVPHGRRRKIDEVLAYEIHAALGRGGREPARRLCVELRADEWLVAGKAEDRIAEGAGNRKLVHVGDNKLARLALAAPPGCDIRQAEGLR